MVYISIDMHTILYLGLDLLTEGILLRPQQLLLSPPLFVSLGLVLAFVAVINFRVI